MCSCFVSILEHALQTSASFCCNMSQPIMTYGWGAAKHPCPKAKHLWTSSEHLRNMEICFWLHRAIMIKGIQRQQKILQNDKNTKQTELSQHMDTGSSCLLLHVFEAKSMRNATGVHGSKHKLYPTPEAWGLTFKSLLLSDPDRSLSNLWFFFLQYDSVWCIASCMAKGHFVFGPFESNESMKSTHKK
jgi:hypothetical protein